jgi:type I restriction enzyme M protein
MALKKSQLYSKLWQSCDELRGGMDASQYKDYVLTLLFVKYVSDKYAADPAALIEVPPGARFADMVAAKGDKEIGDRINKGLGKLASVNPSLQGAINVADFNDEEKLGKGKEMVDRLSKLVAIFEGLDFGRNRAEGDDLLGDAYEYLMRHFATESGKSKGQFYTPAEVSRVMAQVIGLDKATSATQTIYDPTCGSGSLLLKAHDLAKSRTGHDLTLYGQEMDNATSALARMNMVLHDCPTAEIWPANSLSTPHFKDERNALRLKAFDYVVANPPFSQKNWTSGLDPANDLYGRFGTKAHDWGVPPPKNGDFAFLLHILTSLKSTGRGAVILPHGVLFRGGAEGAIRRKLVQQGVILALVGLPANLFYGTGIPACIVVLDKAGAPGRRGIFMIDASKGYIKDGNKNRLRAQDMHRIVDTFHRQLEQPRYARMVPVAEIETNDFNLNLPRYIDTSEAEDLQDIEAHLKGGIPDRDLDALAAYWQVLPGVRAQLFASLADEAGRPGYSRLLAEPAQVKATIFGHPEFTAFRQQVQTRFEAWRTAQRPGIETLSEALLAAFQGAPAAPSGAAPPLIDAYNVYQRLMDYWDETMNDDAWAIALDGWQAMADGKPNFDLIPEHLVIARYFAKEQAQVDALEAERDAVTLELEELIEEHGADDGPLDEARNDKGKVTGKGVKDRLREIRGDKDADEERAVLEKLQALFDREATASKVLKDAQKALAAKVLLKFGQLTADEVKVLVVDDKWLAELHARVDGELDRVSHALNARVMQLAERYHDSLPALDAQASELSGRVYARLRSMGFAWT